MEQLDLVQVSDQHVVRDRIGLFGELKAGQIVMVDAEGGTGPEAQFTFKGEQKPDAVPDVPPAEIESRPAATGVSSSGPTGGAEGRLTAE